MKTLTAISRSLLIVTMLLGAGTARAEVIDFSYSWGISPGSIFTGTGNATPGGASTGSIAFALAQDASSSATLGGSATPIPGATVTTTSSAGGAVGPDHFNSAFSMTLHLTDSASGKSADLTFAGTLFGDLTSKSSTVQTTFAPVFRQTTLGGHVYTVRFDPNPVNIQAPNSTDPTKVNAQVKVVDSRSSPPPPMQTTPEPATLVLAGLAVPLVGAIVHRNRRRASA
jgi:hypothetical protein